MSEIQTNTLAGTASRAPPPADQSASAAPTVLRAAAPASKPAQASAKPQMVDPRELQKKLEEAVKRLNEQMQDNRRQLGFSVDNRLNRQIVRVTNQETGELVRQIPSEVVIRVANSIENLKGVLFDEEF